MFDPARFYSASEVWRGSHAPRELVYRALDSGELRALRRGKKWLIPGSAALEWIGSAGRETPRPGKTDALKAGA